MPGKSPGVGLGVGPIVGIVVVHFGSLDDTRECLDSVRRVTYAERVTVLVHNGTAPESLALTQEYPEAVHEIIDVNRGYAAGVNAGTRAAIQHEARYVYALNNDTALDPQSVDQLVAACEREPSIGVIGGMFYYADRPNTVQNSGCYINWMSGKVSTKGEGSLNSGQFSALEEPDFVCGAGFFFPVSVMTEIGGLDERYFLYCEESDWCFRVRAAGRRIVRLEHARLYHRGGRAVNAQAGLYPYFATRNKIWLVRRWAPPVTFWAFVAVHIMGRYPKMVVGRIVRRDWTGLWQLLRGIRDGLWPTRVASEVQLPARKGQDRTLVHERDRYGTPITG